jgi:hypothetical protein
MTYSEWMAARELLAQEFIGALVAQIQAKEDADFEAARKALQ